MKLEVEFIEALSPERKEKLLSRSMEDVSEILEEMRAICQRIRREGDRVSLEHYRKHKPGIQPADLKVTPREIEEAYTLLKPEVIQALKEASAHIRKFHQAQTEREMWSIQIREGILAGRMIRPLERIGAYVPGGQAAYPSSVLMNIIPAKVAGVGEVVACTPPLPGMKANPAILVACHLTGADHIIKIGGPWAIGSLAYGTETVPKVDKIVGPGNKYVTAAKLAVFGEVGIDSPAGPSESLILADETAESEWVCWDFLSQVEHDQDAAAVLVSTSQALAEEVIKKIVEKWPGLPRKEILEKAIERNSAVLVARSLDEALDFTNAYAAEHLQIVTRDPFAVLLRIQHAGSIFLGPWAPVPVGDYASGTNHVLPTGRMARIFSGLSVDDFIKKPTFQYLSREGLKAVAPVVITLAEEEGLPIHAQTVKVRIG